MPGDNPKKLNFLEIICPHCHSRYFYGNKEEPTPGNFCAFCGKILPSTKLTEGTHSETTSYTNINRTGGESVTLVHGHAPQTDQIKFSIGPYQILEKIGQGGMGEVFLAYDTTCGRRIALKRIRTDLSEHRQLYRRFLKEARITSQLTHPAIIPIYAIHEEAGIIYYTMPYVEGENLKQILRKTKQQAKNGEKLDHLGGSIPALIRVLISICQAVAYAHSKNVLHRDLKPENIIVGNFGQVLILDWGLANMLHTNREKSEEIEPEEETNSLHGLTRFGKVVGTIAYMSPERGKGAPATLQSDIYALGVILYQMLTLRLPFKRGTLQEFRKSMDQEQFTDPAEVAPYRDVPVVLTRISQKCLAANSDERYKTVNELLHDLESYIEGRAEWLEAAKLDIQDKDDWQFQENVLIAEHIAITRSTEAFDWVSLMISKTSFSENIKLRAKVRIGTRGHGIGILLCIPEIEERKHLNDGYCLWLGTESSKSTKLLRSTVEVVTASDVFLRPDEWYLVEIEKMDNHIYLYLNNILQFTYVSHLPLTGTHIGILSRDADFEINDFYVYTGSQSVMVNCLAVPDAFLAHKNYSAALSEYRRIGYSFTGRAEGREGLFRAGITLLEQARDAATPSLAREYYDLSLLEFEKLHSTPGAPLEYLGKGLVYQSMQEYEEEIKCYSLAYRRYPHHPLLKVVQEQIVYRLHECARLHRKSTYNLIQLILRHLPQVTTMNNVKKLFINLKKHWEPLPFIEIDAEEENSLQLENAAFAIQIAFWLGKPYFLDEILDELLRSAEQSPILICNTLFAMIELGSGKLASSRIEKIRENLNDKISDDLAIRLNLLEEVIKAQVDVKSVVNDLHISQQLTTPEFRTVYSILNQILKKNDHESFEKVVLGLRKTQYSPYQRIIIHCYMTWFYLQNNDWKSAEAIFDQYTLEDLTDEMNPLYFLYGCWLNITEGEEISQAHFSGLLDVAYPRSWTLAAHYLTNKMGKDGKWLRKAFLWERRRLYRQMALYYYCNGDLSQSEKYTLLEKQEYVTVDP